MTTEPGREPASWTASEIAQRKDWFFQIPPEDENTWKLQLSACAESIEEQALPALPADLERQMRGAAEAVKSGPGFVLIRGIPLAAPLPQLKCFLRSLGTGIGKTMPQNTREELVCEVRDQGGDTAKNRGYQSRVALPFHSDTADVLGLLCVKSARLGGESALVSSLRIYETLARDRPDLLEILKTGLRYAYPDAQGRVTERIPVFGLQDGAVSCRYLRAFIEAAGDLSPSEVRALDAFDEIANAHTMAFNLQMQPGDLLLVNNYTVLHSRTAFEDHDDPDQRRLLLRLWLNISEFRPLPPLVAQQAERYAARVVERAT